MRCGIRISTCAERRGGGGGKRKAGRRLPWTTVLVEANPGPPRSTLAQRGGKQWTRLYCTVEKDFLVFVGLCQSAGDLRETARVLFDPFALDIKRPFSALTFHPRATPPLFTPPLRLSLPNHPLATLTYVPSPSSAGSVTVTSHRAIPTRVHQYHSPSNADRPSHRGR
jgi:hypothetical protein